MKFDAELYMVKGIFSQDDTDPIVKGFYCIDDHGRHFIFDDDFKGYETNPYTLCRNTGRKTKDGDYLYENDVVMFNVPLSNETRYGYIDFDEFYQEYVIRVGIEQRATRRFEDCSNIKITGKNIILSDNDLEWFRNQERAEYEKSKGNVIDNSYCPSKFRR